jgi:hypothetical protein
MMKNELEKEKKRFIKNIEKIAFKYNKKITQRILMISMDNK